MHKLANEMKLSNRNYRLFEPRDETGIAASLLWRRSYSSTESFWITAPDENKATYRLYEISRNKSSSKEIEVAKLCTENLLDVRPHFYQVVEDIQRNGPPLFVIQRYWI